ncbi:site-specific DNA-methyltransferase [Desulfitobacterium sp. LBE]|uniref:DNA methyltransferase n=1 Tax=Desulfitobacterium sp. LBE TaxID=884086 RepID=UPI001FAB249C|nr:site-specific DNA-methyltransferase [Desulfitobacterium sp. LBE]
MFGKNGTSKPQQKRFLSEAKGITVGTLWDDVGTATEATKEIQKLFNREQNFDTPKPERLIERVISLATEEGDIVLDSFLGSGTTVAVAHKMNRKWIGIELGQHCYTHVIPRLNVVIDGEQGGISKLVNWNGGGGFKFYELAESLLVKNERLPIYQINPSYTFEMMVEAICKLEGFKYKPVGEYHGTSSENRFIHVTNEFVNSSYIISVTKNLDKKQSLLIYCTKKQSAMILPENVEIKKIPKDLLAKCNFESEGL